jgi:hypothetical protein
MSLAAVDSNGVSQEVIDKLSNWNQFDEPRPTKHDTHSLCLDV